MRCSLPPLTQKRATWLLEHVFQDPESQHAEAEDRIPEGIQQAEVSPEARLLKVIRAMQFYNVQQRLDDCHALYSVFSDPYFLEGNSEGTTWWLGMALAIKELYGIDDMTLRQTIMGKRSI